MAIAFIRTLVLYIVILVSIRLMGKRQISELQTSELVVTLLISDIAAIPMQDASYPLVSGVIPIAVLVVSEITLSILMLKSMRFRRIVCGRPIVVINDGKLNQQEMRSLRMTTEDLSEQLRSKDIFSLDDVAYAIVETNGKMSIIKKPNQITTTAGMMGVVIPDQGIEVVAISDGEFSDSSLQLINKSRPWAEGILKGKNLTLSEVFLMTANTAGNFQIIKKERS